MKESLLTNFANNCTNDNKKKIWNETRNIYIDILRPLEEAKKQINDNATQQNAQMLNFAIRQYQANQGITEGIASTDSPYWPNPLEVDYIRQNVANDVATISCKIGPMEVPYAMIDSGSDSCVISDNIVRRLGIEIDKRKIYKLKGYATYAETIGTVSNIPITLRNNNDSITESDEFSVVKAEKDKYGKAKSLLVLGTPWQHKVGWEPIVKGEFKVIRNGKTFVFPLSVHRATRKEFIPNMDSFHLEKTSFGLKKTSFGA